MRCREWTEDWSRRDETRTTDESSSVYCLCSERLSLVSLVCVATGVAPFMARAMCDVWRSRGLCADRDSRETRICAAWPSALRATPTARPEHGSRNGIY